MKLKNNLLAPGFILVHKEPHQDSQKLTSFIKRRLKKFHVKKVGHFGTLDPFAEGLMIIGINGCMRLNELLHNHYSKVYRAQGLLGATYDTGDITGKLIQEDTGPYFCPDLFSQDLDHILSELKGQYLQSPPSFSASKFEGKKLHEWKRKHNIDIKLTPKERMIHEIKILQKNFPRLYFEVDVSSGTYVRTLFEDMAQKLGTIGVLETLKRVAIGPHQLKEAYRLDQMIEASDDEFVSFFRAVHELLPSEKVYNLNEQEFMKLKHGVSPSKVHDGFMMHHEVCVGHKSLKQFVVFQHAIDYLESEK